jgi:hypothetical protein
VNDAITVQQVQYPAAQCGKCGCRIYPANKIELHHALHEQHKLRLAQMIRDLKKHSTFKTSRERARGGELGR